MTNLDCPIDTLNSPDSGADRAPSSYNLLLMLGGLATAIYSLTKVADSYNQLNYESSFARVIYSFLKLVMNILHTRDGDLEINTNERQLITAGPHRTGWEAFVLASKMKGTPPRFFATDAFNAIPGVSAFMNMFKTILVEAKATKGDNGQSANAGTLEKASQALKEHGCVALFPQGNFARIGQEPPKVYNGAAKLAVMNKTPVHVIRLDGFWSLENPFIPLFVRNNTYYRAFVSGFHMNNVRTTLCCVIDFHLKPENDHLTDDEKIEEINAQLYAYYRHTQELSSKQISAIKTEIADKKHLLIWRNVVKQDSLHKEIKELKKEKSLMEEESLKYIKAAM